MQNIQRSVSWLVGHNDRWGAKEKMLISRNQPSRDTRPDLRSAHGTRFSSLSTLSHGKTVPFQIPDDGYTVLGSRDTGHSPGPQRSALSYHFGGNCAPLKGKEISGLWHYSGLSDRQFLQAALFQKRRLLLEPILTHIQSGIGSAFSNPREARRS